MANSQYLPFPKLSMAGNVIDLARQTQSYPTGVGPPRKKCNVCLKHKIIEGGRRKGNHFTCKQCRTDNK